MAGFLADNGLQVGDRVGLMLPDVPEFAAFYYGILRLGAVVVPMSALLSERGVRHRLVDSGAQALVASAASRASVGPVARSLGVVAWWLEPGGLADLLGEAPPRDRVEPMAADDTAVIVYTAGITGEPRGAALTHGNLLRNCEVVVNDLLQLTSEDVVLAGLTLSHPFGQTAALNAAVRAGACLVLLARSDAETALGDPARPGGHGDGGRAHDVRRDAAGLAAHRPGSAAPARLRLRRRGDAGGGAARVRGGVPLPGPRGLRARGDVSGGHLQPDGPPPSGVDRHPGDRCRARVVDDAGAQVEDGEPGEIAVRGHNVMSEYWGRPEETAATIVDGRLRTGDVGVRDEDGFFYVVDRVKDSSPGEGAGSSRGRSRRCSSSTEPWSRQP